MKNKWTGYLDQNGKKIYDGDKVAINSIPPETSAGRILQKSNQIGVVKDGLFHLPKRYKIRGSDIPLSNYIFDGLNLLVKLKK